ncbi:hypothetical protein SPRG_03835 [Saprolegnia parasitica CBS 223.65]|uniref:Ribosome biogenesis protein SLX9 n=1 Tax=Saprolegnia parasitica (strain CBS 223.65) TaxID=695850 RepID=A0A067CWR8_SAPPC|nr:hypothetical protein SPRG_03835 [Saprolegnia parasitica CBS 223.65]KDO31217.1 hypothetical protein SPRG_03835 [Saprolegnia parasitica CBS 223.65]|eukprot:XP_012197822.1 hypothetical protein SPRG_03835 [Saprolegnia parasitica CBS 223.65]
MGKVRRTKTYRVHQPAAVAATKDDDAASDAGEPEVGEAHLSRGQRKRQKRRDAFLKKMGMVQRTVAEKEKAAKKETDGMFGDLEELQKSLFSEAPAAVKVVEAAPKTVSQMTGKQKKRMAMQELGHLKAVQTHPAFQSNPFAAIQMHLQNTVVHNNEHATKTKN